MKSMFEQLSECGKKKTKKEKIAALHELCEKYTQILIFIRFVLEPEVEWLLPQEDILYNVFEGFDVEENLYKEVYRFYLFVKGGHPTLTLEKRKQLFIQMLETLCLEDAKLAHNAKNKKIEVPGLTHTIFKEAFPEYLKDK